MSREKKWMAMSLCLMGVLLLPAAKVHAAPRLNYSKLTIKQDSTKKLKLRGTSAKVKWSTSNEKIVTVNEKGKIETLKGGNAVITAKAGKKKYRCKVYVVGVNAPVLTLNQGATFTLKVKNGKNTKWTTKNKKIASVSAKGKVKAKKPGTATIICQTNRRKVKCKVYVPSLNISSLRMTAGTQYQMQVYDTAEECRWESDNPQAVAVDENGLLTASIEGGRATIICKTGKATMECEVKAVSPGNIVTPMSELPQESVGDIFNVTVQSYPETRTYQIYRQAANVNKPSGNDLVRPVYMPNSGCAACAVSTVLSGYAGMTWGPAYMVETIEKNEFGDEWLRNYSKKTPMPVSLYGITRILDRYGVANEYVRAFDPVGAYQQIENHLKTGNAVVIEVKKVGNDTRWSNSKHTLVLLGMTDTGQVIVADSADRTNYFGRQRRVKYASLLDFVSTYMFSCKNLDSTDAYYTNEASCGGYILVNPQ